MNNELNERNPFMPRIKIGFPDIPTPPELKALHEAQETLMKNLIREVLATFQPPKIETIVGLPDAAKALNVKPSTLRKMCYQGRIGYISDGKNLKFKVADLNRYIETHYHPEGEPS